MEFIGLGLSAAAVVMVPLGAVVKKSYNTEKRLTALETKDIGTDAAIVRIEEKLDRLIERFL